jgi:peptidoglycan/LPS O-acetylase OafA/YrhL
MKAIILYPIFLVSGVLLAVFTGLLVERQVSAGASILVFIAMFFLSFYVAWLLTKFIVDRSITKTASDRPV